MVDWCEGLTTSIDHLKLQTQYCRQAYVHLALLEACLSEAYNKGVCSSQLVTEQLVSTAVYKMNRPPCCGCCNHTCCCCNCDDALQLRKDINSWVAKYRRDDKFSGRPSYG